MNGEQQEWTNEDRLELRIQYLEEKLQLFTKILKHYMTKEEAKEYNAILKHYELCNLEKR